MRLTTTKAFSISTENLNKMHFFEPWSRTGPYDLQFAFGSDVVTISLERSLEMGDRWVRVLSMTCPNWPEKRVLNQLIGIDDTFPYFGGRRFWFRCPLPKDGQICSNRVGVLYLPLAGDSYGGFGCRCCHNLRYPPNANNARETNRATLRKVRKLLNYQILLYKHCEDCGVSLALFEGKGVTIRSKRCPKCQEARSRG